MTLISTFFGTTNTTAQPTELRVISPGNGSHEGNSVITDEAGFIYLTGQHQTARFEDGVRFAELLGERIPVIGRTDYFVAKFSPDLEPVWIRTAGSDQFDFGTVVRVTENGDIVVTGAYQGTMNFHGQELSHLGRADSFIARYDASGNLLWVRTINGNENVVIDGLAMDKAGDIYMTGRLSHLATFGEQEIGVRFQIRGFLSKLNRDGEFLFSKTIVPTSDSGAIVIDAGHDGRLYVGGTYAANESGVFVGGYSPTGTEEFLHVFSGGGEISDIELGSDNKLYVCGRFGGTELNLNGIVLKNQSTFFSGFAAKIDLNGDVDWGKIMGDRGLQMALDGSNTAYIAGYYQEATHSVGGTTLTNAGRLDVFISSISSQGETNWVKGYSSDSTDLARTITLGPDGALIFAGEATNAAFGVDPLGGAVFLAKTEPFADLAVPLPNTPRLSMSWEGGQLELSWDDTAEGFSVEATLSLTISFGDATPFLEPIPGRQNTFRVSTNTSAAYFRLVQP
ncbi:hypothetical protein N8737_02515 [Verrucomicrobia bacterium]|nr:hypothetical protein [Verrucomicrobiota bacterium]